MFWEAFDAWRIPLGLDSSYDNASKYCAHINRLILIADMRAKQCTICPTCEQTLPVHLQNDIIAPPIQHDLPSLATQKISSISGEFSASSHELTKV